MGYESPMALYNDLVDLAKMGALNQNVVTPGWRPRDMASVRIEDLYPLSQAEMFKNSTVEESGFKFGKKSQTELAGVKPELVALSGFALGYCTQDFMIFDGLRTEAEQRAYVAKGSSQTMNSKHRMQNDGFSHAVDAVPVVGVLPKWDWTLIYPIAAAFDRAATEMNIANHIRWGGAWDRTLADFGGNLAAYKRECELYAQRHPGKDFLDGPHFEWVE